MRSKKPLAERFWSKVNKQGPILITKLGRCWEYTGALSNGYGSICVIEEDGTHRSEVTHRVAWFLATGTWPSEHILHKCDNKKCVRRSHHFEGTHGDNMRDMISKGKGPIGENNGQAKLSAKEAKEIKLGLTRGISVSIIAGLYGIAVRTVYDIKQNKTWRQV